MPPAERARETGAASERTLYRRTERFEEEGMESLFSAEGAKRRVLPRWIRRTIAEFKGEHPPLNPNEISNIVWVRTGRKPDRKTVKRVLSEEPIPLRMVRRFEPYHDIPEARERRLAVVRLHAEGWTVKAIAGYLGVNRDTVYRTLKRWIEEDVEGLEDKPRGRPPGVRKVDLGTIERVRRLQENPGLGAFRVRAALKQAGIHLSTATCGRILARNRAIYGLGKPAGGGRPKKPMPFASNKRHEYWSVDVRYLDMVDKDLVGGMAYAITVIENHSRMILANAVSPTQDLSAYLSVLYAAVESYGSPGALVTDSGSVFLANRAMAVYEALGITKHEIQRGRPWQNYAETTFGIQKRMADWHFAKAGSWAELVEAHEKWVADYNAQDHFAHEGRDDGKRSPREVLGWLTEVRFRPEDLERAFFSTRFSRKLDALGYATFRRWRLYGEEGLAGSEAALWLQEKSLMLEHAGETLSRYEVELLPGSGRLREVRRPTLFETSLRRSRAQARLFGLEEALGDGWLKALKLGEYAARRPRRPEALQGVLFAYLDAL
ncbi:MAG: helix-turn-helix domain-containing protein [Actinomycetota bacterium]|nr:helix-turn-helix domain-containing protein [Actinomycetota bacterium]